MDDSSHPDYFSKAVRPRFRGSVPRLLLITSKYFLMGEVIIACERLKIPHRLLIIENEEVAQTEFVARLLHEVLYFQPDCVLTLNHLGIDREGVLIHLLERLRLPLASWFLDNPQLIIHLYHGLVSPWVTIFTWDADNLPRLHEEGYEHAYYLPLGTNPARFHPHQEKLPSPLFPAKISFVGNSMVEKVAKKMEKNTFPDVLLKKYREIATAFRSSPERSIRLFLLHYNDEIATAYNALPSRDIQLEYEAMLTWETTLQYRADCVSGILPLHPLIVGDPGWKIIFRNSSTWDLHRVVTYYDELPRVYPFSEINFNCTSQQMKGAVNQRVFDVPASGAFVLSDWREQLGDLLELGKEIIVYHSPEEALDLAKYYLMHPDERQRIVKAGRKRVLTEHTWDKRVLTILDTMRSIYAD